MKDAPPLDYADAETGDAPSIGRQLRWIVGVGAILYAIRPLWQTGHYLARQAGWLPLGRISIMNPIEWSGWVLAIGGQLLLLFGGVLLLARVRVAPLLIRSGAIAVIVSAGGLQAYWGLRPPWIAGLQGAVMLAERAVGFVSESVPVAILAALTCGPLRRRMLKRT